jgi:hypothetical protein
MVFYIGDYAVHLIRKKSNDPCKSKNEFGICGNDFTNPLNQGELISLNILKAYDLTERSE